MTVYLITFFYLYFSASTKCHANKGFKFLDTNLVNGINTFAKTIKIPKIARHKPCDGRIGSAYWNYLNYLKTSSSKLTPKTPKTPKTPSSLTLSYMFLYSEKIGAIIGIVATMGLIFKLLEAQNFGKSNVDPNTKIVMVGPWLLLASFISFLIMGPEEYRNWHYIFAFVVIISGLIFTILCRNIYAREYKIEDETDDKGTISTVKHLDNAMWALIIISIFFLVTVIFKYNRIFLGRPDEIKWLKHGADDFTALAEVAHIITFSIVLFIISELPPLPVNNVCLLAVPDTGPPLVPEVSDNLE